MSVAIVTGSSGLIGQQMVRFLPTRAWTSSASTTTCARFLRAGGFTAWIASALERDVKTIAMSTSTSATRPRSDTVFRATARHRRSSCTPPRSRRTTGPRASRSPTSRSTPSARSTCSRPPGSTAPRRRFIFTQHQQGLRRHAQPAAAGGDRRRAGRSTPAHPFAAHGIDETMSIDASKHSLFGASKVAADVIVQEYGRYFGMKTGVLPRRLPHRPGARRRGAARLPGLPDEMHRDRQALHGLRLQGQAGARQHPQRTTWSTRSGISSRRRAPARSTTSAAPATPTARCSRPSSSARRSAGTKLDWTYKDDNRTGDHIWWISDVRKFQRTIPAWRYSPGSLEDSDLSASVARSLVPPSRRASGSPAVRLMRSVVIPAARRGAGSRPRCALCTTLERRGMPHEIVVVDDHSTDGTRGVLTRLAGEFLHLRPIENDGRRGFGLAVRAGPRRLSGDAVSIFMADASDDPRTSWCYFARSRRVRLRLRLPLHRRREGRRLPAAQARAQPAGQLASSGCCSASPTTT